VSKIITCLYVLGLAAAVGCAAPTPWVLHDPVGPQGKFLNPPGTGGVLVVYSAPRVGAYAQSEYPVYTDYTIYSHDDKVVQRVDNRAGSFYQNPATVSLRPGEYRVKALAGRGGFVVVPVIIEEGKTTVVDLDGTAVPQDSKVEGQWVRLPDGHIVGWQGDCGTRSCR
jgi:hypothetical protein